MVNVLLYLIQALGLQLIPVEDDVTNDKSKTVSYKQNHDPKYKYYLASTELEKVNEIKDLGVLFDSELSFVSHYTEKINRA